MCSSVFGKMVLSMCSGISNTETKQMYDITNLAILGVPSGLSAGKW
mgnify:CR=1 FL=1